jgi:hypothetical protein
MPATPGTPASVRSSFTLPAIELPWSVVFHSVMVAVNPSPVAVPRSVTTPLPTVPLTDPIAPTARRRTTTRPSDAGNPSRAGREFGFAPARRVG